MPIARYKDLCIDSSNSERLGRFWAAALGLRFEPDGEAGSLAGEIPEQRVWMNVVPEAKTVKHRVHIDIHAGSIDELVRLGAQVLESAEEFDRHWTVMSDPEGGEFCAFVRAPDELPSYRMYELVIDCARPEAVARWWADIFGLKVDGRADKDWWWFEGVPGMPYGSWDFVPVPEPKTVKNRIHWDVTVESVAALVTAGATILRSPTPEGKWHVMADPEGNEFCAFTRTP